MAEKNLIEQAFEPQPEIVPVGEYASSAETGELIKAFVRMQSALAGAQMSGVDPIHNGRRYANINDVREALRGPMAANGLAMMQFPCAQGDGRVSLVTRIVHVSGQWIQTPAIHATIVDVRGNATTNLQSLGTAITYLCRYQAKPLVGLFDDDDDAAAASGKEAPAPESGACPKCGKELRLRKGKQGEFYGCSGYPNCKYTRDASTSQPQPDSQGTVVPPPEPEAVPADDAERKKLRAVLKKSGNAAGLDDTALSVWIRGMGHNTQTCSLDTIQGCINMLPVVAKEYEDWLALTQDMKDASNIVNILNADATHFLQLRSDDRTAALAQARLKASEGVPF